MAQPGLRLSHAIKERLRVQICIPVESISRLASSLSRPATSAPRDLGVTTVGCMGNGGLVAREGKWSATKVARGPLCLPSSACSFPRRACTHALWGEVRSPVPAIAQMSS